MSRERDRFSYKRACRAMDRRAESVRLLNDPATADNMEVRKALMARVTNGELTLREAQFALADLKRKARRDGKAVWGSR